MAVKARRIFFHSSLRKNYKGVVLYMVPSEIGLIYPVTDTFELKLAIVCPAASISIKIL